MGKYGGKSFGGKRGGGLPSLKPGKNTFSTRSNRFNLSSRFRFSGLSIIIENIIEIFKAIIS